MFNNPIRGWEKSVDYPRDLSEVEAPKMSELEMALIVFKDEITRIEEFLGGRITKVYPDGRFDLTEDSGVRVSFDIESDKAVDDYMLKHYRKQLQSLIKRMGGVIPNMELLHSDNPPLRK